MLCFIYVYFDFGKVELAVDQFWIMREVNCRYKLDRRVVNHLDVFKGYPLVKVQFFETGLTLDQWLNFRVHVSAVIHFDKLEVKASIMVSKLVYSRDDVWVGNHVDPLLNIL